MADNVDQTRVIGNRQISDAVSADDPFRKAAARGRGEVTRELGGVAYGRERPRTSANVRGRPRASPDVRGRPQTFADVRERLLVSANVCGCWRTSANVSEHMSLSASRSDIRPELRTAAALPATSVDKQTSLLAI